MNGKKNLNTSNVILQSKTTYYKYMQEEFKYI